MAERLVLDELWREIESLATYVPSSDGGRPPVSNRAVFTCVVYLLKTGIGYRDRPTGMGASEKTVRRRLKTWSEMGLWDQIFEQLLTKLRIAGRLDVAEVLIDAGLLNAPCGGERSGQTQRIVDVAGVN